MKPLIALVALALGAGAVGVTLTIQSNRFAFTSLGEGTMPVAEALLPPKPAAPAAVSRTVQLDEVTVAGVLTPVKKPVRRAPLRPVAVVEPEPVVHVVPAPCVDGEYRKLEENRGVRLMCPGNSMLAE
jgi:hypothetical protein